MLARGGAALSSPKQAGAERSSSLFPYYAGFSEAFVRDAIGALELKPNQVVLDPWNGSGTTTAVASQVGLRSVGIDLNPAMAVVAKARLATRGDITSARLILSSLNGRISQKFLREACYSPQRSKDRSILLLAIFRLLREKLRNQDRVGTNPTWWHVDRSEVVLALTSITRSQIEGELVALNSILLSQSTKKARSTLIQSDLLAATSASVGQVDVIITSPPYLTRIDYVKATLPELLVLSLLDEFSLDDMRSSMIGSSLVGRGPDSIPCDIGEYAKEVLTNVASHSSKASTTYYSAFFSTYIVKMLSAFQKLGQLSKIDSRMVLVVQGSYYKEHFVDLARLSIELASFAGFQFVSRADFNFKQSFAQLNPRANGYSVDTARETVILLERNL